LQTEALVGVSPFMDMCLMIDAIGPYRP